MGSLELGEPHVADGRLLLHVSGVLTHAGDFDVGGESSDREKGGGYEPQSGISCLLLPV